MSWLRVAIACTVVIACTTLLRSAIQVDASFDPGTGADAPVVAAVAQSDGSVFVGGLFRNFQGAAVSGICKLDSGGRRVAAFDAQLQMPASGGVIALALQGERLIAGGAFTQVRGTARAGLVRLLADGQADPAFVPPFLAPTAVTAVALAPDGKLYVAGALVLTGAPGQVRWVVRLNADGSLDPTFSSAPEIFDGFQSTPTIFALALDRRGRLLVGGEIRLAAASASHLSTPLAGPALVRLTPAGAVDTTFVPSAGASGAVSTIVVRDDGRLLLSGDLSAAAAGGGISALRLHPDGSLDKSFRPKVQGKQIEILTTDALLPLSTGHVLLGGNLTAVDGAARSNIAVVRADGSPDPKFTLGAGANGSVIRAVATPAGVLIVGDFTQVGTAVRGRVARIAVTPEAAEVVEVLANPATILTGENTALQVSANGAAPLAYTWSFKGAVISTGSSPILGLTGLQTTNAGQYSVSVRAADGTIATGSVSVAVQARPLPGRLDENYRPVVQDDYADAFIAEDGSIVLGSAGIIRFPRSAGISALRLTADGQIDSAFSLKDFGLTRVLTGSDGGLWVTGGGAGWPNPYGGSPIARLNADFSVNTSFKPKFPTGFWTISALGPTAAGGIVVEAESLSERKIFAFRPDGSVEPSFNGGAPLAYPKVNTSASQFAMTADGWLYRGQKVTAGVSRFKPDGTADTANYEDSLYLVPSLDGSVYLRGRTKVDKATGFKGLLYRVGANGQLDASFHPPAVDDWKAAAVDAQGRIYGVYGEQFVRLNRDGSIDPSYGDPGRFSPGFDGKITVSPSGKYALFQSIPRAGDNFRSGLLRFVDRPTGPARLSNLSTRAYTGPGEETLIVGFVVEGTAAVPMLLRGIGPTLKNLGVAGALSAAQIQLFRGSVAAEKNAGWSSVVGAGTLFARVGAFPLSPDTLDAALSLELASGAYSTMVSPGGSSSPGVALAEIYDANTAATPTARLVNLSARGKIGAGDQVLIAGFVLGGTGERQFLVRGIGPALATSGLSRVQSAPVVSIVKADRQLVKNEGWDQVEYPEIVAAAAGRVGAFALTQGSGDAALLVRLVPGVYSAVVSSGAGTEGIGLVEIYEVSE